MQNYVTNRITLHDAEQEEIDKVFDFLRGEDCEIDFNNIILMPEEIKETMTESSRIDDAWAYYHARKLGDYTEIDKIFGYAWVEKEGIKTRDELLDYLFEEDDGIYKYGEHLYKLEKKYGCHDWYEWSLEHWGVKWNACGARREGNIIVFETPWEGVPKLMLMVSEKFPQVVMDYEFADEDFGYNTARYTFTAGIVMAAYEPVDNTIESRQLSKSILGWEPPVDFDDDAA